MASLGKIRFNYRGQWTSGTAYSPMDVVFFRGGWVVCRNAHTSTTSNSPGDTLRMYADQGQYNGTNSNTVFGSTYASSNWQLMTEAMNAARSYSTTTVNRQDQETDNANQWATGQTQRYLYGWYNAPITGWQYGTTGGLDVHTGEWIASGTTMGYKFEQSSTIRDFGGGSGADPSETYFRMGNRTQNWNATYQLGDPERDRLNLTTPYGWTKKRVAVRGWPNMGRIDFGYGKTSTYEVSRPSSKPHFHIGNAIYVGYGCYFINRRGGVMAAGPSTNYSGQYDATNNHGNDGHFTEMAFHHLDWLEGQLPTDDGSPPRCIQWERTYQGNLVLFDNGEVHYWGYGGHGQPGGGDNSSTVSGPVRCGYSNINRTGATTVLRGKRAIKIALTGNTNDDTALSCYALIDNGNGTNTLYSWGYNGYGQLGTGNTTSYNVPQALSISTNGKIIDVWAGGGNYGSVYILTDTGYMYSCGYNAYGQLGRGNTTNQSTFGLVKAWGSSNTTGVKQISYCGRQYAALAVTTVDGQLWTWGRNNYYNLGHGDTTDRTSPTRVSTYTDVQAAFMTGHQNNHYMIILRGSSMSNNTAYFVGRNAYNQASDGGDTTTRQTFVTIKRTSIDASGTSAVNMTNVGSFRRMFGNSNGTEMGYLLGRVESDTNSPSRSYTEHYRPNGSQVRATNNYLGMDSGQLVYLVEGDQIYSRGKNIRWYYVGYSNYGGPGIGLSHDRNDYRMNMPFSSASETNGNTRILHSNIRFPVGVNQYRMDFSGDWGYNTTCTSAWCDVETGQLYVTGYTGYGIGPHSQETQTDTYQMQPPQGL